MLCLLNNSLSTKITKTNGLSTECRLNENKNAAEKIISGKALFKFPAF